MARRLVGAFVSLRGRAKRIRRCGVGRRWIAVGLAAGIFVPHAARAGDSTWTLNGDGDWGTPGNWSSGVPSTLGDNATFAGAITAPHTINQNINNLTIGSITFANANRYTLSGNTITLDETPVPGSPTLSVIVGNHTIASTLVCNDPLLVSSNPNTTLTLSGIISGTGAGIVKFNGGLTLSGTQSNIYSGNFECQQGTLHLAKTAGIAIPGGTLSIGRLMPTVTTATVVIDHGGNLATSVAVVINEGSQLDGGGIFTVLGNGLTMKGGSIVNADLRIANQNVVVNASSVSSSIAGVPGSDRGLDFFGQSRVFTVAASANPQALIVSAPITNGGVHKSGGGGMVMSSTGNTYAGSTIVDGGLLQLQSSLTGSSDLSISSSGRMEVAANGSRVIKTHSVSITPSAGSTPQLDLKDNKLIVTLQAVGTWDGSKYTDVTGLIQSGRNPVPMTGKWTGSGIVTSMNDAVNSNLTSIGIATGAQAKGIAPTETSVWAGQVIGASSALVMYTYGGDANLDGKINVDDYTRIDFNVPLGTKGWYNGDFNYDGKINVDDYTIIDFNVGIQGAPFSTGAGLSGVTAVPEPGAFLTLGLAAVFGAKRYRRRLMR